MEDMKRREEELRQAEQDWIRAEKEQERVQATAAEEKKMHRMQIAKLEEELRRAKEVAGNIEHENESSEGENGCHLKRGRSKSEDSRQESTFSGTVGANLLTSRLGTAPSAAPSSTPSRLATLTEAPQFRSSQLAHSLMNMMLGSN